jgi:hypothetical protein
MKWESNNFCPSYDLSKEHVFFHFLIFTGPNRHAQKRISIFLNSHWVIRIRNRLPGDEYPASQLESLRLGKFYKQN